MTQRKPTALKKLAGNPGKRALPEHEPRPGPASVRAPYGVLSPEALKLWRRLAPILSRLGLLTELDVEAVADMVTCLARLRQAEAILEEEGLVIPGARGGWVRHPACLVVNGYRAAVLRYAARFGLTPADRAGLEVLVEEEEDELAALLFRRGVKVSGD